MAKSRGHCERKRQLWVMRGTGNWRGFRAPSTMELAPCWLMMEGWSRSPIHKSVAFGNALILKTFFPFIWFTGPNCFEPFGKKLHEERTLILSRDEQWKLKFLLSLSNQSYSATPTIPSPLLFLHTPWNPLLHPSNLSLASPKSYFSISFLKSFCFTML